MRILRRTDFVWNGLGLHLGKSRKPMLMLIPDETFPHLFRIQYQDGWLSSPANLARAKYAAFGHARYLLTEASRDVAP